MNVARKWVFPIVWILVFAAIAAALVKIAFFPDSSQASDPDFPSVEIVEPQYSVTRGTISNDVSLTGSVISDAAVPIPATGSGEVREILVSQGQQVSAGQQILLIRSQVAYSDGTSGTEWDYATAPVSGTLSSFTALVGQQFAVGDPVGQIAPPGFKVTGNIPPEQLYRKALDPRSDIYALAAVLYECAIGESVFTGGNPKEIADQIIAGTVEPMLKRAPNRDRRLASAIDRAMRVDPLERFQTAALFRAAIEPILEEAGPLATRALLRDTVRTLVPGGTGTLPESHHESTEHWARIAERGAKTKRRWIVVVAAMAMAALLGGAAWLAVVSDHPIAAPVEPPVQLAPAPAAAPPVTAAPPANPEPTLAPEGSVPTVAPEPPPETGALPPPPVEPHPQREPRRGHAKPAVTPPDVPPAPDGFLTLNAVPWAYVTIDDHRLDGVTPFLDVRLAPGKHTLIVQSSDGRSQTIEVSVRSGEHVTRIVRF